jgi:hypothetical protein
VWTKSSKTYASFPFCLLRSSFKSSRVAEQDLSQFNLSNLLGNRCGNIYQNAECTYSNSAISLKGFILQYINLWAKHLLHKILQWKMENK